MFDVLIRQGRIIDGTGGRASVADIGIRGTRIEAVGRLEGSSASRSIDASGMTVAPGFIDSHTHSGLNLLVDPRALSSLRQGVTTEVIGNCGYSPAPVLNSGVVKATEMLAGGPVEIDWRTFGEYLERIRASSPSINVVALVGHGPLRMAVPHLGDRRASGEEIQVMRKLLQDALQEGARGFSTGLEYSPGSNADFSELRSLVAEVGDRVYSTHIRSRNGERLAAAVDEALATIEGLDAHLQISHLGPRSPMPPCEFDAMLIGISQASKEGGDIGFDVLMYDWGPHHLADILPGWLQQKPAEEVLEELTEPEVMREIRMDSRSSVQYLFSTGRAHTVKLVYAPHSPRWVGMDFQQIAEETSKDPFEVAVDILLAAGTGLRTIGLATPYTDEMLIRRLIAEPRAVPASDGAAVCKDGPLAGTHTWVHSYGWAARYLQEYILRLGILTLEEGIRRLTSLPAQYFRLEDRGLIRAGCAADLVVFDAAGVRDRSAGRDGPDYAEGMRHVLVNGQIAVENGVETGVRAGRVL
jgi:N-acyl-D-aspartate/D-glutamate deacylase